VDIRSWSVAYNDSTFRRAGQEVQADALPRGAGPADTVRFICECTDPICMRIVHLSRLQYEAVREQGAAIFLVAPGHLVAATERIVERHTTYWVIRKHRGRRPGRPAPSSPDMTAAQL
jgi:hypothetical protein